MPWNNVKIWPQTGSPVWMPTPILQRAKRGDDITADIQALLPQLHWPPVITGDPWPVMTGDPTQWPDVAVVEANLNGIDSILDRVGVTAEDLRATIRAVYETMGWRPEEAMMLQNVMMAAQTAQAGRATKGVTP